MANEAARRSVENIASLPIMEDFLTFLEYVKSKRVKLTKARDYLTKRDLLAINGMMKQPGPAIPEHGNQSTYPLIHLFYHLAIDLNLIQINSLTKTATLSINEELLNKYKGLNRTEQYVSLLNSFWITSDWEEMQGGSYNYAPSTVDLLIEKLTEVPVNKEVSVHVDQFRLDILYRYDYFLLYFEYFGFWEVSLKAKNKSDDFKYEAEAITLTPLYKFLENFLYEAWLDRSLLIYEEMDLLKENSLDTTEKEQEMEEHSVTPLLSRLQLIFPENELSSILNKQTAPFFNGTFHLQVSLNPSCWRTIKLSSTHTLLDLHDLIQVAFDFDDDHLYAFYMDGKRFSKHCYHAPFTGELPAVDETALGELQLYVGKSFLYLFDFGDEWHFFIQVLKMEETDELDFKPKIESAKGESPQQYDTFPDW